MKIPSFKKEIFLLVFSIISLDLLPQTFIEQTTISLPGITGGGSWNPRLAFVDIDNDGDLDIIIAGGNNGIIVNSYRNDGSNQFTPLNNLYLDMNVASLSWGDYNNDNYLDLVASGYSSNGIVTKVYKNNGNSTFSEQTSIVLDGVVNSSIKWGDYDNDGLLDLLITGNFISKIYRNNGDNTFTEQTGITLTPVNYSAAAWGDYDNDGYLDIILMGNDKTNKYITDIYHNNGNNTFSRLTNTGIQPLVDGSVEWGDYNNDGKIDLLLTGINNSGYNSIIYKNNGNGTFSKQSSISLQGTAGGSANFGDFNNDGNLDIILTGAAYLNSSYQPFSKIYRNNNDNSFTELTDITLPQVSSSNAIWGDYDNDNKLDILIAGNTGTIGCVTKVFKNNVALSNTAPTAPENLNSIVNGNNVLFSWKKVKSDNTPSNAITYNIKVGTKSGKSNVLSPNSAQDGYRRIVGAGNTQLDTVFYLTGLRWDTTYYARVQAVDNGFLGGPFSNECQFVPAAIQSSELNGKTLNHSSLHLTWKRGNGDQCIIFAKEGSSGLSAPQNFTTYYANSQFGDGSPIGSSGWFCIFKGTGDSVIVTGLQKTKNYVFHVIEFQNKSGKEVYCQLTGTDNIGVFSTGQFTEQTAITLSNTYTSSLAWGDYNNDGFNDLILSGYSAGICTKVFKNNGDNTFSEQTGISIIGVDQGSIAWGDYDNDGDLDILITGRDASSNNISKIYRNNNDNTFSELTDVNLTPVFLGSAKWGDYDNDGDLDILLSGASGNNADAAPITKIYRNDNGTFTDIGANLTGIWWGTNGWLDYDNDGHLDIYISGLTGNTSSSCTRIYRNDGNNHFIQTNISLQGLYGCSFAPGDYNNDGFLDILLTGIGYFGGYSKIYLNNGNGTFTEEYNIPLTEIQQGNGVWFDYDNDGYLDIILSGNISNIPVAKMYHNNGNNSFSELNDIIIPGSCSAIDVCDYDNDGDVDIVIGGGLKFARIFKNNLLTKAGLLDPNKTPQPPGRLNSKTLPKGSLLTWSPVISDETSFKTMTYNIKIGTGKDKSDILSPNSSSSGYRRIVAMGNTQLDTSFIIRDLPTGKYFWRVQAVDQGYEGGTWSAIDSFMVKNVQAFFKTDTVCQGLPIHFTDQSVATDGVASWKWDFKDGSVSALQNPAHIYSSGGTYNVKLVITSTGGIKDSLEQNVVVRLKPITGFNAPIVCQGTATAITSTTNTNGLSISSWYWSFGDGQSSTDQQPSAHGYLGAGNYNVQLKALASNGCIDSTSQTVTVAAYPVAVITASSPLTFCKGDSTVLSVMKNSNYTYKWFVDGAGLTNGDSSKYTPKNTGSYWIEVVNKTGNCKTTSDPSQVTVHDAPVSPLIQTSGPVTFCQGDSVVLNVPNTSGYSYLWKLNGGAVGNGQPSYIAKSSGVYSIIVTNSSGCSVNSINTVNVTVNSKPTVPTVSISGVTAFCQGGSVDLSVPFNSSYSYQWQNTGSNIAGASSNTYSALGSGVYSLSITNSSNCVSKTENVLINVSSVPAAPTISLSGPSQFCQGDSIIMSVTNTAGYTYQWKLNGGAFGTNQNSLIAKTSGTYSLVISNSSGCSVNSTNSVTVTVNSKPAVPTVSISGATSFCQGGSVELSVPINSAYTYQWQNNGSPISGAATNTYSALGTGVYSLSIINSSNCVSKTENVTINVLTVPATPTISVSGPTQFCQGDSVVLSVTNIPGSVYQWKLNGGATGLNTNTYTAKSAGTYSLVLSNSSGCSASSTNSVNVIVNSLPVVSNISSGGPTSFCQGGNVVLNVTNNSSYSYQWINGSSSVTGATTNSYTANASGNYQLQITNTSGCSVKTSGVAVTVKANPYKPIIRSDNYKTGQCLGESPIRLQTEQVVTGYNYQWMRYGTPISNATLSYLEGFLAQGDYTLEADLSGCKAVSDAFGVSFQDAPAKPSIYAQGPSVWFLACSNDSASQYKWYYDGNVISGADKYIYVAGKNLGKYYVSIANAKGCFTMSDVMTIPTGATGTEYVSSLAGLRIYPNPSTGLLSIEMDNNLFGDVYIELFSSSGKEILNSRKEKSARVFLMNMDLSKYPKGIYFIYLHIQRYFSTNKVIIE